MKLRRVDDHALLRDGLAGEPVDGRGDLSIVSAATHQRTQVMTMIANRPR